MKKIHFSNVNFNSNSGPNTFGSRLAYALIQKGYEIVESDKDYDVFLCFIEPSSRPKAGKKFILRLDGIWFKPSQFETHNRNIKWAYDNCDMVVWQSEFDKKMTQKWWGKKEGVVIPNGIDLGYKPKIHPELQKIKDQYDRIFTCSANWHRQKRLKENIEFFQKNKDKNDALFVLGKNPDYLVKDENIIYFNHQPHDICLQIYSLSDWFLHLAWLDHCPNVVVEALSQKCPVVYTDSGGTREIVGKNGIEIPESNPYNFELTDYDSPYALDIEKISLNKPKINNKHLDINKIAKMYEEIF